MAGLQDIRTRLTSLPRIAGLQFLWTHLTLLLCTVCGLAFIILGVAGMLSDSVRQSMQTRLQTLGANEINSLKANVRNRSIIDAEKTRGMLFEQEDQATWEEVRRISQRKLLMEGVFPSPANMVRPFEFRDAYHQALQALPRRVDGGTPATAQEIADEVQNVAELKQREAEALAEGGPIAPAIGQRDAAAPGAGGAVAEGGGIVSDAGAVVTEGGAVTGRPAAGGAATTEPKYDPWLRAQVAKARSIRCYIDPASIHRVPLGTVGVKPEPRDMWFAQVSLWIQQDVLDAIARLNSDTAAQLQEAEPCVEHVPVKRVVSMRVAGYLRPDGKGLVAIPGGEARAEQASPSFSGRLPDDQFDIVRFSVTAVVDQRHLPRLIDYLTRQNFFKCLGASYERVHPDDARNGYLYGTAPAVLARLDFEAYLPRMLGENNQEIMPPEVRELLTQASGGP